MSISIILCSIWRRQISSTFCLCLSAHLEHILTTSIRFSFEKFAGTPVITITAHIDGYPCIMLDNRTGMKEAIEHLIKVHGCKKIGMVSGPKTSDDALERLDVYKETLEENGIIYDEKRVAYGNFQNSVLTKSES